MNGQYNPQAHGANGNTFVSITGTPQAIDDAIIEASNELQGEFAYREDYNAGDALGLGEIAACPLPWKVKVN